MTTHPETRLVSVEALKCADLLVQELAPDQGHRATSAFGLAVSLQAMLSAAPSPQQPGELRERVEAAIRKNIKVDASGLAPAVASCFVTGIEDATDAILAALQPEPQQRAGWQKIETAPKDGQSILAICATAYSPVAGVTCWLDGWTHYSRPAEKWHGGVGKWFPTHWMPLPPAPAHQDEEG